VTILQQSSILALLVLAESLVLITGKFDLSLESTVGLAPMIGGWLVATAAIGGSGLMLNPYLAIAATLLVGVLVGACNGFLIVRLGLKRLYRHALYVDSPQGYHLRHDKWEDPLQPPSEFTYLGSAVWFGIPASIWICGFSSPWDLCSCATIVLGARSMPSRKR